jgi:hypothetical protein
MVDAQNSAVLHVENRIMYQSGIDGTGMVWQPDPLRQAAVYYGGQYSDPGGNDSDTESLNSQRIQVILNELTNENDNFVLRGPYVQLTDIESPVDTFAQSISADSFSFRRSQQEFEHVMVYYHIDKAYRYLNSLGFDIPGLYEFRADPHGLNGEDNSYYIGGAANYCAFGEGGVDDAEDAAVIWHEYAHAIQENIAQMSYSGETAALQEGSSDYWAASFNRSLTEFAWGHVFLWDAGIRSADDSSGAFWSGRRCDLNLHYPEDYINVPNYRFVNGQIWSSALMHIWNDLSRNITDRLFLQAHYLWGNSPDLSAAAHAFIKADSLLYNGSHVPVIIEWFQFHGLIDIYDFFPEIVHQPLSDTENTTDPYRIDTEVIPAQAALDTSNLWVYWGYSENIQDSVKLIPDLGENMYFTTLPVSGSDTTYFYFIEVQDIRGNLSRDPADAPQVLHHFRVGPDRQAPTIIHIPINDQALSRWPVNVSAQIEDNIGIEKVWVEYKTTNNAILDSFRLFPISDLWYSESFALPEDSLSQNDSVFYRILARDSSSQRNETAIPEQNFFSFRITSGGGEITYYLETDDGGFQSNGDWQWGNPTSGPFGAYNGNTIWGTNLSGNYSIGPARSDLTLPEIDLSSFSHVTLRFWHWYNFEDSFDGGNIKVSIDNGQNWQIVTPLLGYDVILDANYQNPLSGQPAFSGFNGGWQMEEIGLEEFINERIIIRFEMGSDDSYASDGWYLDDIVINEYLAKLRPPASLQVLENRGVVILAWDDILSKKSFTNYTSNTDSKKLSMAQREIHATKQNQTLNYRIFKSEFDQAFSLIDSTEQTTYTDSSVTAGQSYHYYITSIIDSIESEPSDTVTTTVQAVVSINRTPEVPLYYTLEQNYPNPFNPQTTIRYQLPKGGNVRLELFSVTGRRIITLYNGYRNAGVYQELWDGHDTYGAEVSSGIYFYRLSTAGFLKTRKLVLMR